MNLDTLKQVAWIGDELIAGQIKAVAVEFHGLGYQMLKREYTPEEQRWAKDGILVVFPYYGPWSWMNREARAFVDDVVEAVYTHYEIDKSIPLFSVGGSMGGLSALLYSRYSKHPIKACRAHYPVCDLKVHFHERPDLPRTIYAAFRGYKEPFEEILHEHSPIDQVEFMPNIPYFILHGDQDTQVNKRLHSDRFVAEMRKGDHQIEYIEVPGYGHGGTLPEQVNEQSTAFIYGQIEI